MRRVVVAVLMVVLAGCSRSASRDAGVTTTPAAGLTTESCDPALARDPASGDLVLAWVGGDSLGWRIWFSRAATGGSSWSAPIAVSPEGEHLHPHGESSPRLIAAPGGKLALLWTTSREVAGRQWPASDVRFSRSVDGGRSWSAPMTLNDDTTAAPASHGFHGATLEGDSGLAVAWLDERHVPDASAEGPDDASIYLIRSSDFGVTWTANRPQWGAVCPCCRVTLAGARSGTLAAWRRHFPGQIRDVVVASLDGAPGRVHEDGWRFEGCPHSGPAVAVSEDGRTHLAWYTGAAGRAGVWYRADTTAAPTAIVTGDRVPVTHVSMSLAGADAFVACDVDSSGHRAVTLARVASDGRVLRRVRVPGSEGGVYPQVVATGVDRASVAWTSAGEGQRAVAVADVRLEE
jgi:hypothetical protein